MADQGARRCEVTTAAAVRRQQRRRASAAGLVPLALVGILAVVGAGLAVQTVLASRSNPSTSAAGTTVRTSWGTMQVHQSEVVSGLSDRALGGMSHGVQNLVGRFLQVLHFLRLFFDLRIQPGECGLQLAVHAVELNRELL